MMNNVLWLYSPEPTADWRMPVRWLADAAMAVAPELAGPIAALRAQVDAPEASTSAGVELDGAALGAPGPIAFAVTSRPDLAVPSSPDDPVTIAGQWADVLIYPRPGGPDCSGLVALTAAALAAGAVEAARAGWLWAAALPAAVPGAWVIGRPEHPPVAYGLGADRPADPEIEAHEVDRLAAAVAVVEEIAHG